MAKMNLSLIWFTFPSNCSLVQLLIVTTREIFFEYVQRYPALQMQFKSEELPAVDVVEEGHAVIVRGEAQ